MRKTLSAILVLLMLLTLVLTSCGNNTAEETEARTEKNTEASATVTQETVDAAADMIYTFNKPGENNIVTTSFTVPSKLIDYEGFDMDVTWEVEGGNGLVTLENGAEENKTTVKVNPYADNDTEFSLKGKVGCGGFTSKEIKFTYVIKQYSIADWQYWAENTSGVTMNVKGVIVAKYPYSESNKNTGVFLLDLDGEHGYFAYRIKCNSAEAYEKDLAIGNVIVASGTTSIYNGFRELGAGCTYTPVYNDDGSVMTSEVKKISLDDIIKEGVDLDKALDQYQATVATITGAKVKSIDWNSNTADTYYEKGAGSVYVTVTKNNVDFKLYLSTSNSLTLDELKAEYEKLGIGYSINVEGPVAWYNGAQIYPCAGGITVTSTDLSDEEKIANELNAMGIPENTKEDLTIDLPAKGSAYDTVKFEWKLTSEGTAKIENGKLVIKVGTGIEEVKLALTATCGEATETKEFTIVVMPENLSEEDIVNALYKLGAGKSLPGTFTLKGKIKEINTAYSDQYANITVTIIVGDMTDKPVQCYRMKGDGAAALKAGDVITVTGTLKHFSKDGNSTFEFDAGCTLDKVEAGAEEESSKTEDSSEVTTKKPDEPDKPVLDTPEKILKAAYDLDKGTALDGTFTLSGEITKVNTPYDSGYENVTVTIVCSGLTDYPLQCFRMKGTGADKIKIGDKITVSGKIKKHTDGTVEYEAGCKLESIDFVSEYTETKYETPEEIVKALYALEKGDSLPGNPYQLTGKVTSIVEPYTNEYKNVTFVIVVEGLDDYPVTVFRIKGEGVESIKVGDTVTVKGNLIHYFSSTKNTSTFEFTTGASIVK